MSDVENELRSRVDSFVQELSTLIRRQALAAVEDVLKSGGRPESSSRGARAPQRGRAAAAPARAVKVVASKRKAGEKRTPQEIQAVTAQLLSYIKANAGQRVEEIATGLSTSTKELTLPIRKLLKDKKLGAKGQKRATRYFPR
jgi:hypothetical protein